jgi:hypothetical protein
VNPNYPVVAQRAGHRCEYCRAPEAVFNFPFEVEHALPSSRQGSDRLENLALACRACNIHKTDSVSALDEITNTEVQLFHPRQDRWEDHFRIDTETGTISGLTAIGRVTAAQLHINSAAQLAARRQWARLGLYP